jgi:hypothetical protein
LMCLKMRSAPFPRSLLGRIGLLPSVPLTTRLSSGSCVVSSVHSSTPIITTSSQQSVLTPNPVSGRCCMTISQLSLTMVLTRTIQTLTALYILQLFLKLPTLLRVGTTTICTLNDERCSTNLRSQYISCVVLSFLPLSGTLPVTRLPLLLTPLQITSTCL